MGPDTLKYYAERAASPFRRVRNTKGRERDLSQFTPLTQMRILSSNADRLIDSFGILTLMSLGWHQNKNLLIDHAGAKKVLESDHQRMSNFLALTDHQNSNVGSYLLLQDHTRRKLQD